MDCRRVRATTTAACRKASHLRAATPTRRPVRRRQVFAIELRNYLRILRRRRGLVIAVIVAALLAGFTITPRQSSYIAKAQLYVGSRDIDVNRNNGNVSGDLALGLTYLANSFAQMIQSRTIAQSALASANVDRTLDDAQAEITAAATSGTQLVVISVTDRDPTVAARLANGAADSLVDLVREQERQQNPSDAAATTPVSVFEHASPPTNPEPTGLLRNLILAGLFGLVAAVGLVVLLEYLDLTIKSADDAQHRLQLRVLGAIPFDAAADVA
jgi:capsular polysaccharide biosynthesis protein